MSVDDVTLFSAFLVGLLSSTHCVGMCGGIVSALSLGAHPTGANARPAPGYVLAYNAGRIASYAVAGAAMGWVGAGVLQSVPSATAQTIARALSALFTIALGLYLSGWWRGLGVLERIGAKLWAHIEPLGRRLLPVNHPAKAALFGLVWGWLPCGLVYTALAWSLASGSAERGAALMAAFGIGTLPMLLGIGLAARSFAGIGARPWWRRAVGAALLTLGFYLLLTLLTQGGHAH